MAIATDGGSTATGNAVNDAYGSKTATAGTEITRTIPPRPLARAKASGFVYTAGANLHTLTFQVTLAKVAMSTDAASGQAVIALTQIPSAPDGSLIAASDWVIVQHEDGVWTEYKVSSVSGLNITLTANLAKKVLKNTVVYFMGAPADHVDRQYTINASQTLSIYGGDVRVCIATALNDNEPILANCDNVTAAGKLQWLAYTYGSAA